MVQLLKIFSYCFQIGCFQKVFFCVVVGFVLFSKISRACCVRGKTVTDNQRHLLSHRLIWINFWFWLFTVFNLSQYQPQETFFESSRMFSFNISLKTFFNSRFSNFFLSSEQVFKAFSLHHQPTNSLRYPHTQTSSPLEQTTNNCTSVLLLSFLSCRNVSEVHILLKSRAHDRHASQSERRTFWVRINGLNKEPIAWKLRLHRSNKSDEMVQFV